ncbi:MAG: metallophosphoesterase [Burkholderiales bacterium]|nr:metallophosphoesterase [Burkholderiales bacterium]
MKKSKTLMVILTTILAASVLTACNSGGASLATAKTNSNAIKKFGPEEVDKFSKTQLEFIENQLTPGAKDYFKNILHLQKAATLCKENCGNPAFIYGDMDGSFGRVVLSAISAGAITINHKDVLSLLAILLENEYKTVQSGKLAEFQNSEQYAKQIEMLIQYLVSNKSFIKTNHDTIFIGDIVWDRFSCNIPAMKTLLENLHAQNVVFILGNHDGYDEAKLLGLGSKSNSSVQAGNFAKYKISEFEAKHLEQKVFQNAYYNPINKIFTIHTGVSEYNNALLLGGDGKNTKYVTINNYNDFSPENLVSKINNINFSSQNLGFTSFRPSDNTMQKLSYFRNKDITIVHGHNADMNINDPSVVNLNARNGGDFKPAAVVLGK